MINYMPRVLGSMMLRPGLGYLGSTASDAAARCLAFVFSVSDKALIELTDSLMRVWISDALVTRVSVSSAVANGNFNTDVASWTDNDESGGTSVWVAGGYLGLTGNGTAAAIRDQTVAVAGGDINVEHALRIVINRGPVTVRVGTSTTDDSYVTETDLQTGAHSLAFTPTGNFNIRLMSRVKRQVLVDSCNVEGAGVMTIPTPWLAANLSSVRFDQSGDVLFVSVFGFTQRRIERRTTRSWSVVQYFADDGPFRGDNVGPITMTPAALSGNTTLTASAAYFKSTNAPSTNNAGSIFRIASSGQRVTATVTGQDQFTSAINVTGTGTQRPFTVIRTGLTATGSTVTLQRSLESSSGPWVDVTTYTTDGTVSFDDGLSNQLAWYRIGAKTGNYSSGSISLELNYSGGSITGICRVTGFTSSTIVSVEVLTDFGATTASADWAEGEWSDRRGWPSATAFHEGRLWWAGKDKEWGSITDAFDSHDPAFDGDAGPINRSIGQGPVDTINWLLSLQRLLAGGQMSEWSARSSSLDEPLTPTNFNLKTASTQGSAGVDAIKIDNNGYFVQKSGTRVFELSLAADPSAVDYAPVDLTQLVPEIGEPSIVRSAVQRQPDTRLHFVRSDGTAAVLVFDKTENTIAWLEIESIDHNADQGLIEDVVVLPGTSIEDQVYYVVKRTINGATKRYLERWAMESEAKGTSLNKQADAFVTYTGAAATVITGLGHLEGREVAVWAAGADVGTSTSTATAWDFTYTVSGGQITLATAATNICIGLPYRARWKSSKLALAAALGTSLTKRKRVPGLGLVLADTHAQGLFFGRDFTNMDNLPLIRDGAPVDSAAVIADIDEGSIPFPGEWSTDSRVCLESRAPRCATIIAMVADTEMHEQH